MTDLLLGSLFDERLLIVIGIPTFNRVLLSALVLPAL